MNSEDIKNLPQPFGFYRLVTGGEDLHFGLWPEDRPDLSLPEAQAVLSEALLTRLPTAPARVLDVGCGLGHTADTLSRLGHEVVALAPEAGLIDYARRHHPGPEYLAAGFLDAHPRLAPPERYQVILFQESLQYFPDLDAVFAKVQALLDPETGRVLICDEVSHDPATREHSAVHWVAEIEQALAARGFYVVHHRRVGTGVLPTCEFASRQLTEQLPHIIEIFGEQIVPLCQHFARGWQQQLEWYRRGQFGYEIWELRPSPYSLRPYQPGDEQALNTAFQEVFGVSRSLEHWRWKFMDSPFGPGPISTVWHGDALAAQYAGYIIPLWQEDRLESGLHIGDTLTRPAYRGVGRGPTSLLVRAFRLFERLYCENHISFGYGFLTDKIERFGGRFLGYQSDTPVYEWVLQGETLAAWWDTVIDANLVQPGDSVTGENRVGDWADELFQAARSDYPWMVARNRAYLDWRYARHPDYAYRFYLMRRDGRPLGWWLTRVENGVLLLGDALFRAETAEPVARLALIAGLHELRGQGVTIHRVQGWFAQTPSWWNRVLENLGFIKQRQFQNLNFCLKSYRPGQTEREVAENFYFTHGDSDLF